MLDDRFWSKVDKLGNFECWLWTAAATRDGYGVFSVRRRRVYAHRWVYEALVGAIPEGMQIDHLCKIRNCVNPAHMEVVTLEENARRAGALNADRRRPVAELRTHCSGGHLFDEANTIWENGWRKCRACRKTARTIRRRSRAPVQP